MVNISNSQHGSQSGGSRHRRFPSSAGAGLDTTLILNPEDPVTTTKALLLQIVAPRKFVVPKDLVKEDEEEETVDVAAEDVSTVDSNAEQNEIPSTLEIVERIADDDGAAAAAAASEDPSNKEAPQRQEQSAAGDKQQEKEKDEIEPDPSTEDSQEITPEERATVVKKKDDPEQGVIVNVEELLRITFNNLALEWHLLNIPTYTIVRHLSPAEKEVAKTDDADDVPFFSFKIGNRHDSQMEIEDKDDMDNISLEWIQITVMVRPASLGIILDRIDRIGVGTNCGTLSVFKAELCKTASPYAAHRPEEAAASTDGNVDQLPPPPDKNDKGGGDDGGAESKSTATSTAPPEATDNSNNEAAVQARAIAAARAEFKNAATRLRIEQVREQIVEQAAFSFDFIALLTVASMLAGIGLITDNTVVIVASMLVSPIMGPVLGLTFGTRIADWPLVRTSFIHECLALLGCVVIGVLVGIAAGFTDLAENEWPTNEMEIRGEAQGLLTGIAIAIPSGMGVCLSILGGNTSSLVGVAISASLLPPAVNAGVCLVYAIFLKAGALQPPDSMKDAEDFAKIGGISLALTLVNILCIWVAGLIMFEIKEVAPTQSKNAFWAKDIKAARELNKKKSPPVDVSVIRRGLKSALNREPSDRPVSKVELQPSPRSSSATAAPRPYNNLNAAFSLEQRKKTTSSFFNPLFWGVGADKEGGMDGEGTDDGENVQYVGLEDMANLLGFNSEDHGDGDDGQGAPVATPKPERRRFFF